AEVGAEDTAAPAGLPVASAGLPVASAAGRLVVASRPGPQPRPGTLWCSPPQPGAGWRRRNPPPGPTLPYPRQPEVLQREAVALRARREAKEQRPTEAGQPAPQ